MTKPFLILGGSLDGQRRELPVTCSHFANVERVSNLEMFDEDEDNQPEAELLIEDYANIEVTTVYYVLRAFRHQGVDVLFFVHESLQDAGPEKWETLLRRHKEITNTTASVKEDSHG